MNEVVVLAGAESNLLEIYSNLEDVSEGLGDRLEEAFQKVCRLLAHHPGVGSHYAGGYRKYLLRRWHLGVFYSIHGQRLFIIAVLDLRRDRRAILRDLGLL